MVRRDLGSPPPASWPSVVLDSEGLRAVARNNSEDARAVLASSRQAGVPVLVPTVVLAETLIGDQRDARVNDRAVTPAAIAANDTGKLQLFAADSGLLHESGVRLGELSFFSV